MTYRSRRAMDLQAENKKFGDAPANIEYLWEEAKSIFYKDVGEAKIAKLYDRTSLQDTVNDLKLVQNKVSKEYGTHAVNVGGKEIDVRLGRIMTRLELMLQVGDVAMQFGPETVSLVWSAFRMIFTVCLPGSALAQVS